MKHEIRDKLQIENPSLPILNNNIYMKHERREKLQIENPSLPNSKL